MPNLLGGDEKEGEIMKISTFHILAIGRLYCSLGAILAASVIVLM